MQNGARGLFDAAGAGHTILVPNTELAAALLDTVERMHIAAGHDLWPTPQIRDFGSWLRERYVERQRLDPSLPRVLSDIEERELWRAVVKDSSAGGDFLEPAGAARSARRARRALFEYGIPEGSLAEYPTDETLALIDWMGGFEQRCRELGCIASDRLPEFIAAAPRNLAWIESPIWRPVAATWLQRNAIAILHPAATLEPASARCVPAGSPDAELAAIAGWAREGLRTQPDFRAWICIPDLNLRRTNVVDAFDAVLAPHRFSLGTRETAAAYAVAGGVPLADYAPVRIALDCLSAAAGSLPFEEFSALLRRPELQPAAADDVAAASLDLVLRSLGPHEATLKHWLDLSATLARAKLARPVVAIERLQGFLRTLETARGGHPFSRWVSLWVKAFEGGPWALRSRWSSAEFQAAERFRELLATLATADASFGSLSMTTAGRMLARAAHDTAFQPKTGIPPIWATGQIIDPWLAYQGIWVAGASEDRWPPPVDPIPLLPVKLQRNHGVIPASPESQLRFAEALQGRWRFRAALNVFSCAAAEDGRAAIFSPLLPATPVAAGVASATHPHWRALADRAPRLESRVDERAPRFAAPERMRGIATLRAQSRCAFRGFAETRLQTERLEKPVPGFNMRERGEMLHHALETIWSDLRSSARLEAIAPGVLDALINEGVVRAIARQCARRDPGLRWQRREVPRMSALLGKWLRTELLREPFEVESLELAGQTARHGGLEFAVRIDRIDRLRDGGRVLIDYKTGMTAPDWRGDRPDNPQLPIYALLQPHDLKAVAYGTVNASECGFVAETGRRGIFKPGRGPSALEGLPDFDALVARWSERIEKIASEFAAGNAEVAPTLRACASCVLQALCRVPTALSDDENLDG